MHVGTISTVSRLVNCGSFTYSGLDVKPGAQMIRIPHGSKIEGGLTLCGGASYRSAFCALRGGVLKFHPERQDRAFLASFNNVRVPTGFVLLDAGEFMRARDISEAAGVEQIVRREIVAGEERLYLVHSGYVHPEQLFLPIGDYFQSVFTPAKSITAKAHEEMCDGALYLSEAKIKAGKNILDELKVRPKYIIVDLIEQGTVELRRNV